MGEKENSQVRIEDLLITTRNIGSVFDYSRQELILKITTDKLVVSSVKIPPNKRFEILAALFNFKDIHGKPISAIILPNQEDKIYFEGLHKAELESIFCEPEFMPSEEDYIQFLSYFLNVYFERFISRDKKCFGRYYRKPYTGDVCQILDILYKYKQASIALIPRMDIPGQQCSHSNPALINMDLLDKNEIIEKRIQLSEGRHETIVVSKYKERLFVDGVSISRVKMSSIEIDLNPSVETQNHFPFDPRDRGTKTHTFSTDILESSITAFFNRLGYTPRGTAVLKSPERKAVQLDVITALATAQSLKPPQPHQMQTPPRPAPQPTASAVPKPAPAPSQTPQRPAPVAVATPAAPKPVTQQQQTPQSIPRPAPQPAPMGRKTLSQVLLSQKQSPVPQPTVKPSPVPSSPSSIPRPAPQPVPKPSPVQTPQPSPKPVQIPQSTSSVVNPTPPQPSPIPAPKPSPVQANQPIPAPKPSPVQANQPILVPFQAFQQLPSAQRPNPQTSSSAPKATQAPQPSPVQSVPKPAQAPQTAPKPAPTQTQSAIPQTAPKPGQPQTSPKPAPTQTPQQVSKPTQQTAPIQSTTPQQPQKPAQVPQTAPKAAQAVQQVLPSQKTVQQPAPKPVQTIQQVVQLTQALQQATKQAQTPQTAPKPTQASNQASTQSAPKPAQTQLFTKPAQAQQSSTSTQAQQTSTAPAPKPSPPVQTTTAQPTTKPVQPEKPPPQAQQTTKPSSQSSQPKPSAPPAPVEPKNAPIEEPKESSQKEEPKKEMYIRRQRAIAPGDLVVFQPSSYGVVLADNGDSIKVQTIYNESLNVPIDTVIRINDDNTTRDMRGRRVMPGDCVRVKHGPGETSGPRCRVTHTLMKKACVELKGQASWYGQRQLELYEDDIGLVIS